MQGYLCVGEKMGKYGGYFVPTVLFFFLVAFFKWGKLTDFFLMGKSSKKDRGLSNMRLIMSWPGGFFMLYFFSFGVFGKGKRENYVG